MSTSPDDELAKIRERVASQPDNLQYRFELGVALSNRHEHGAAIAELHRAMGSPQLRWRAMDLIAQAFDARGMHESAAQMREQISRESGEGGDSGSAPIPFPTRPFTPPDSSGARKIPDEDNP